MLVVQIVAVEQGECLFLKLPLASGVSGIKVLK